MNAFVRKSGSWVLLLLLLAAGAACSDNGEAAATGTETPGGNGGGENPGNDPAPERGRWSLSKIVSQVGYAADGITEDSRQEYDYDDKGREVGYRYYLHGRLASCYRNYNYEGTVGSHESISYDENGAVDYTSREEIGYYGELYDRGKVCYQVSYEPGEEAYRYGNFYTFDREGRETRFQYYLGNEVWRESVDYRHEGNSMTYTSVSYSNGKETSRNTERIVFYDDEWNRGKLSELVYFDSDGKETVRQEFDYDEEGRLMDFRSYFEGRLTSGYRDVTYDGKCCRFTQIDYDAAGNVERERLYERTFY